MNLGVGKYVCVCVSAFWEKRCNWNCFGLPIFTFSVKRQRKDKTSVRSCNLVNSARSLKSENNDKNVNYKNNNANSNNGFSF